MLEHAKGMLFGWQEKVKGGVKQAVRGRSRPMSGHEKCWQGPFRPGAVIQPSGSDAVCDMPGYLDQNFRSGGSPRSKVACPGVDVIHIPRYLDLKCGESVAGMSSLTSVRYVV